jgi:hypothetical protein
MAVWELDQPKGRREPTLLEPSVGYCCTTDARVGRIEFENESVTVLRVHMAPHEKTPMHDIVSARLVIWLTNAHLKDTGSDGSVSEYNRPAGSIDWVMPRRHMGENLTDQGLDFLAIIPKVVSASGPHGTLPQ